MKPTRRRFLHGFALAAMVMSRGARSTSMDRPRRIGWLTNVKNYGGAGNKAINLVLARLADLGWVQGRNMIFEPRWSENRTELLAGLAAELVALNVDVIITQTEAAAQAAKSATATIPIVFTGVTDPVRAGLVTSLAQPGNNITGTTNQPGPGFVAKMCQLLKQAAPDVSRVAMLGIGDPAVAEVERIAGSVGVTIVRTQATTYHEVPSALEAAAKGGTNGLIALATPMNDPNRQLIVDFARQHRWPAIGGDRTFAEWGGLMSYWADWNEIRYRTADYVDKILRGARPGTLPIERPAKFELVLNLRTARAINVSIPQSLRLRADQLID